METHAPSSAGSGRVSSPTQEAEQPLVSVLVCTCNRKDNVVRTIESVRTCGYARFELFILDQSHGNDTEQAVGELCRVDPRLNYTRLAQPNKPRALNHGLRLAKGRYILLTDDDCEVQPDWIDAIVTAFASDERIGCIFGDVASAPHDSSEGYIPGCQITRAHTIFGLSEFLIMPDWKNFGMGANLALRTRALLDIGGWDPCIGPGAYFKSGDDHDVVARMLVAGNGLAFCPGSRVVHYGLRYWKNAGQDQARYGFGMGAAFAKQLRIGTYYAGPMRVFGDGLRKSFRGFLRGERPLGLTYPISWVRGVWQGLRHPIDRRTRSFISSGDETDGQLDDRVAKVVLRSQQDDARLRGEDER